MNLFTSSFKNKKISLFAEITVGLIIISVVLFGFQFGTDYLVKHSNHSQYGKVNSIFNGQVTEDIVCFGSSVSEVGFNSKIIESITNKSTYNSAIDGTRIKQLEPLIELLSNKPNKPQYILFGLSYFEFASTSKITAPDRYIAHFSQQEIIAMFQSIDKETARKLSYFPFSKISYYNHTYYKNGFIGLSNLIKKQNSTKPINKGYTPKDKAFYVPNFDEVKNTKSEVGIDEQVVKSFEELIVKIKNSRTEPVFIIYPVYLGAKTYFNNYSSYLQTIDSIATSNGILVLDYSSHPITENKDYFYNIGHLNRQGADSISTLIGFELKKHFDKQPN